MKWLGEKFFLYILITNFFICCVASTGLKNKSKQLNYKEHYETVKYN